MVTRLNKNRGFTIIELLIVVVIIAVLIGIGTAVYTGVVSRANTVNLLSDLDANSGTLRLYYTSYGSYPTALDANRCPSAPTADTGFCLKLSSGNTLTSYYGDSKYFELYMSNGSLNYVVTASTTPTLARPTFSSIYSTYDLLFCRYTTDCSGIPGISAEFSYQVAFTAKASSKYAINMVQIDGSSTNWITGTLITTNITYSTPTTGASLTSNIITTTNAGETRVTFTGTGLRDKTLVARITEVDSSNNPINGTSHTKALGVYTTVGSYTLTSPAANTVNYLVVAGGGGGGFDAGGGGGAGGLLAGALAITAKSYSIIVGSGGAGSTNNSASNGTNSAWDSITSIGGGRGGDGINGAGSPMGGNGGSGGGGCGDGPGNVVYLGGSGTLSQGNPGGSGFHTPGNNTGGGGGGGAGTSGFNMPGIPPTSNPQSAGDGGTGSASAISGLSLTYAGGGGGGINTDGANMGAAGAGGSGGGGAGSRTGNGSAGTSNLGGGGGGGVRTGGAGGSGGSGGSGIVIFRTT